MIATERLLDVFVDVADTLTDDFDLIDFLHHLTDHVSSVIPGSSVGLLLSDRHDRLQFMAASSRGAEYLELFQLQNSEGPCLDCYRSREPVIVPDLDAETQRWPLFVPRAAKSGLHSVHAFPMRLRDQTIGALNVFGEQRLPLGAEDVQVIQALTHLATIALIQERAVAAAELLTEQLEGALNSRIVIEQAKGVVAQSLSIGVERRLRPDPAPCPQPSPAPDRSRT